MTLAASDAALAAQAELVVSAVTASQTEAVAYAAAPGLQPGAYCLDVNSASPGAKQRTAAVVDTCGAPCRADALERHRHPGRLQPPAQW